MSKQNSQSFVSGAIYVELARTSHHILEVFRRQLLAEIIFLFFLCFDVLNLLWTEETWSVKYLIVALINLRIRFRIDTERSKYWFIVIWNNGLKYLILIFLRFSRRFVTMYFCVWSLKKSMFFWWLKDLKAVRSFLFPTDEATSDVKINATGCGRSLFLVCLWFKHLYHTKCLRYKSRISFFL